MTLSPQYLIAGMRELLGNVVFGFYGRSSTFDSPAHGTSLRR